MKEASSVEFAAALVDKNFAEKDATKIDTMPNCLVAKSAEHDLAFARSIFLDLQRCNKDDTVSSNAMVFSLARAHKLDASLDVFRDMICRSLLPSTRARNAILFECARCGRILKAIQVSCH